MYAPLWCKSNFSFLEGASHPEELVEEAHRLGLTALAVTDRDGVYGMVRAHVKARETGVKLLCGAQLTIADATLPASGISLAHGGHGPGWDVEDDEEEFQNLGRRGRHRRAAARELPDVPTSTIVVLATDRVGWTNLTRLITIGRRRCDKGDSLLTWRELQEHSAGLLALWGGPDSMIAAEEAPTVDLRDAFGDRLYAMTVRHSLAEEVRREPRVMQRAAALGIPLVATTEVLYHRRSRRQLQDIMSCVRHGCTMMDAGKRIRPNDHYALLTPYAFAKLFTDARGAIERSLEIADRCNFSLAELRYRYPSERLPDGSTSAQHLRILCERGADWRYNGDVPPAVNRQLAIELALIEELDYPGYFLTMHEIVSYCHRKNIFCQGRGSAANSIVCYVLGVTAIDPVGMQLLFERFLSRERAEPPDIDLDIEHERREEVIQHVYAVYGRDHAAMVCNIIRYRPRSAIRDVGKALGISETALDRASKQLSHYGTVEPVALQRAGLDESPMFEHVARLAEEILEFPRHLGIHSGGFLLGHEPVHDLVPIENASMTGRTVVQWDKDDLEDLGLFKVDLLALGALHQLHLGFDMLRAHRGIDMTMATVPFDDEATYDMICTADTVGTFQIESRAQMSMLPRLKPRKFYDLVVEVSLVRPGPISGGMVHPYLRRRAGTEEVTYAHECLRPVLERTLGVPLFQEQVMKLAVVAADYTPGEADQLRRDMAAWRRSGRIEKHRERLVGAMQKKGIPREFGERVFEQIRGFGEYGFPESHAASFALIAYVTSWLRCHYLPEFTCSLLNAQPMGFYSVATIVGDAQRHQLEIRPIDIQHSQWDCTLEEVDDDHGFAVRMGLRYVKGLSLPEGKRIAEASPFTGLEDFTRRVKASRRTFDSLASTGAFGSFVDERRDALWQVSGWLARKEDAMPLGGDVQQGANLQKLSALDNIFWDYSASDHSTRGHPLGPLRAELRANKFPDARTLQRGRHGQRLEYIGIVICRQQPGTAAGVVFMTLEDETGFVNLVVWKQVFKQYAEVIRSQSLLGVRGRLQVQEGVVHLIAEHVWQPRLSEAVAHVTSRDFH